MPKKIIHSGLWWLWLTIILIIFDQVSKQQVVATFELYESLPVISGLFNITYVHNYGAAFSFLSDAGGWQRWFFSAVATGVSLLLVYWLYQLSKTERLLGIAYASILGGALGNLLDRNRYGYVVDFLHFHYQTWHFPAFNVADSAITMGAILLIWDATRQYRKLSE